MPSTATDPHQPETATRSTSSSAREGLPWAALLALALAGFVNIMTETMPAGLLPQISTGMGVSQAAAGQWITVYALGTVLAAIPAVTLTRGMRRKPLLLVGTAGFLVANTVTAIAPAYELALGARFIAGAFSGLVWGMLAGYARKLVPAHLTGRALAVAMVGTPLALSLGVPLGTFGGSVMGWRWTFAAMSIVSIALVMWILAAVPDRPGQSAETRTPMPKVLALPGILPVLTVTFGWMLAHNLLYTYIAPYAASTGLHVRVDVVLLVFGVTALVGIWFTGTFVDRALRTLVLASIAAFALGALVLGLGGGMAWTFWAAIVAWGFTFGGAATQVQTALADAAGDDGDVAQSMLVTSWNLAIFGGGALGGIALTTAGPSVFPWIVLALLAITILIALGARRHGFTPGRRGHVDTAEEWPT